MYIKSCILLEAEIMMVKVQYIEDDHICEEKICKRRRMENDTGVIVYLDYSTK